MTPGATHTAANSLMTQTNYPYEISLEVAFRDIDAMGHVNNAVFFAYYEAVRIKYLGEIMEHSGLMGTELLDLPLILVEANCIYKSPALLTEMIYVGTGISRFGNKSFDMLYRVQGEDGRLIAYGKTVQVMYDYVSRSAFPIPDSIRAYVANYQRGWQPPAYP
jgi:acyl-CoA thioester hydrolase